MTTWAIFRWKQPHSTKDHKCKIYIQNKAVKTVQIRLHLLGGVEKNWMRLDMFFNKIGYA